jgi:hypothetical protein
MPTKLFITDERMLLLMEWALKKELASTETEYLEKISFPRTNISNVRKGIQSFTKEHIRNACELTGASADYIFGFQNSMMRKQPKKGIDLLKEAVLSVELELKRK